MGRVGTQLPTHDWFDVGTPKSRAIHTVGGGARSVGLVFQSRHRLHGIVGFKFDQSVVVAMGR